MKMINRIKLFFLVALTALSITACGGGGGGGGGGGNNAPVADAGNIVGDNSTSYTNFNILKSVNTVTEVEALLVTDLYTVGLSSSDTVYIENNDDGLIYTYSIEETQSAIDEYISVIDVGNESNTFRYRYHNGYLVGITYYVQREYEGDFFWAPETHWLPLPDEGLVKPKPSSPTVSPGVVLAKAVAQKISLKGKLRTDYAANCKDETSYSREVTCHILDMIYKPLDLLATPQMFPTEAGILENIPGFLNNGLTEKLAKAKSLIDTTITQLSELKAEMNSTDLLEVIDQSKTFIQTQQSIASDSFIPVKNWFVSYVNAVEEGLTEIDIELLDIPEIISEFIIESDNPNKICSPDTTSTQSCDIENGQGTQTQSCIQDTYINYWGLYSTCQLATCNEGFKNINGKCYELNQSYELELEEAITFDGETCFTQSEITDTSDYYKHACVTASPDSDTGLALTLYQSYRSGKSASKYKKTEMLTCPSGCELQASTVIENSLSDHIFGNVVKLRKSETRLLDAKAEKRYYGEHIYINPKSKHHGTKSTSSQTSSYANGARDSLVLNNFLWFSATRWVDSDRVEICITPDRNDLWYLFYITYNSNLFPYLTWNDDYCSLDMPSQPSLVQDIVDMINAE